MTHFGKEGDSPSVVQPGCQHKQQVVDEQRFVIQIELQGFVVELHVGNLQVGGAAPGSAVLSSVLLLPQILHTHYTVSFWL